MSSDESSGSATSFSDTESEPEVGYLKKRTKQKVVPSHRNPNYYLGIHHRLWMMFFLVSSALAVLMLCVIGDTQQLELNHWEAHEILPNVYLGNYKDALNKRMLENLGITHILTIALGIEPMYPETFRYMTVRAQDNSNQDLLSYLGPMHQFIDEGKRKGGILVHCKVGQSRSAMVMTSYIMKEKGWNTYESLDYLKSIRSLIRPRSPFVEQLEAYNLFKRDLTRPELQTFSQNFPNKAQIAIWPTPGTKESIQKLEQPPWVEIEVWREWWDALVHLNMDFYNRYVRYYMIKK